MCRLWSFARAARRGRCPRRRLILALRTSLSVPTPVRYPAQFPGRCSSQQYGSHGSKLASTGIEKTVA